MRFEEQFSVPVSRAEAWDFLWQTKRLAACLPGCTAVEEQEPGKRYEVQLEDRVGPYRVHFQIEVTVQQVEPQNRIQLLAVGNDRRLGASEKVDLLVTLTDVNANETRLDLIADVEVLGKIAALGQFVIKRKARETVRQFAQNIQTELRPRAAGAPHA